MNVRGLLALAWLILTITLLVHLDAPSTLWWVVQMIVLGVNCFCLGAWLLELIFALGRFLIRQYHRHHLGE